MRSLSRLLLFSLFVGLVSLSFGCAGISRLLISNAQEQEIGKGVDQQIAQEYRLLAPEDPVAQWARQLLAAMVPASAPFRDPQQIGGYSVEVIYDDELVNAFAAPGGYTYLATGLILSAGSCAEIAGVMGHELAHVTERHGAKKLAASAVTLGLTSAVLEQGLTHDLIVGVYSFLQNTAFSRKDESQADEVGVVIMHDTGYSPFALADFFRTLDALPGSRVPQFLSSHPNPGNRAETIEKQIRDLWPSLSRSSSELTTDCVGTTLQLDEVRQRIRSGSLSVRPGTGTGPAASAAP